MHRLGSFTTACFSATNLQSLDLSFDDHTVLYEFPLVSFSDLLPLKPWPYLRSVSLHRVSFHESDLEGFVDRQQMTVKRLIMNSIHLLSGGWLNCLDNVRRFSKLDYVELSWPTGGEFSHETSRLKSCPTNEALVTYVLHGGKNPSKVLLENTDRIMELT